MIAKRVILPLVSLLLLPYFSTAQTSESPWMAGLSAVFLDYQGPMNGNYTQVRSFDPGISFSAHAYVNRFLNASLNSSFVPETQYPLEQDRILGTSLLDVNALVKLKSNGLFLREDALIAPYITTGFGLNTASNNIRLYAPIGLGFHVQVSSNFSIQIESLYKQRLKEGDFQHISHSAGFVFAMPSNKKPKPKPPTRPDPEKDVLAAAPDRDGDGVPDRDDLCPDLKGKSMYLGCPEEPEKGEKTGIAKTEEPDPLPVKTSPADPAPATSSMAATDTDSDPFGSPAGDPSDLDINDGASFTPAPQQTLGSADMAFLERAMQNIYFESGSEQLTWESKTILDTVATILNRYPNFDLQVLGHTDNTGSQNSNIVLSIRRAFNVKYYLVYEKGVRMSRISSDGYSSVAPVSDNESESGRSQNRRVEFKLTPSSGSGSTSYNY
ncbi:MAG: OmpA family protein [Bacteroidota bacterium]